MSKASSARTSALQFDGAFPIIVGNQQAALTLSSATAQSNNNMGTAPYDSYIEELYLNVLTAVTVSNSGVPFSVGNSVSTDVFLSSYLFTATTTGLFRLDLTATTVLTRNVPAGTQLKFSSPISVSTTMVVQVIALLMPRDAT